VKKYLIIQTASIGDVILSTALGESLKKHDPSCQLDYLVKKGNEDVFYGNKSVNEVYIWDKKKDKYKNLLKILGYIQQEKYDAVFNLQRFLTSGIFTVFSGAKKKYGFKKNPLSLFFNKSYAHEYKDKWHEVDRNHQLIAPIVGTEVGRPKLYPTKKDYARVSVFKSHGYITITPASLWYTKQYPKEKWVEFIKALPGELHIYFLGGPADISLCDEIILETGHQNSINTAGKFKFVESAALMRDALMNYVNDSAAQHIASSINAKTTSIFCSTVQTFGFGPLSDDAQVLETTEELKCRPCGLHGHMQCPEGHFKCATQIDTQKLISRLKNAN
jgi:heptosyltransferase-2